MWPECWGLRAPLSCWTDWKAVTCTCCMHSALSCMRQAVCQVRSILVVFHRLS